MIMALLILPGSTSANQVTPKNGKYWTFDELHDIVDGTIAIFGVEGGLMYYNDNFVAEKLFYNLEATELARRAGLPRDEWMAGTVIIVPPGEEEPDDDGARDVVDRDVVDPDPDADRDPDRRIDDGDYDVVDD